jgi:hypothetical protein
MGNNAVTRTDEDELCALHLRNILQGRRGNAEAVRQAILTGGEIARFHDPSDTHHPRDLEIALDTDRFDFAIRGQSVGCQLNNAKGEHLVNTLSGIRLPSVRARD